MKKESEGIPLGLVILVALVIFIIGWTFGYDFGQNRERSAWMNNERKFTEGRLWFKYDDGWRTRESFKSVPTTQTEKPQ